MPPRTPVGIDSEGYGGKRLRVSGFSSTTAGAPGASVHIFHTPAN